MLEGKPGRGILEKCPGRSGSVKGGRRTDEMFGSVGLLGEFDREDLLVVGCWC